MDYSAVILSPVLTEASLLSLAECSIATMLDFYTLEWVPFFFSLQRTSHLIKRGPCLPQSMERRTPFKPWHKNGLRIIRIFFLPRLIKTVTSLSINRAVLASPEGRETLFLSLCWHASHWLLCHTTSGPWPGAAWKRRKASLTFAKLNTWRNFS